jgi:cytochrome P450
MALDHVPSRVGERPQTPEECDGHSDDGGGYSRLRFTEWVVKETMRLYPPVPSVGREALTDCEIGGYHVLKGGQIAVVPWMTRRDERWFGEDADEFRPERWDNDLAKRASVCLLPLR